MVNVVDLIISHSVVSSANPVKSCFLFAEFSSKKFAVQNILFN